MPATYRRTLRIALLGATIGCGHSAPAPATSSGPEIGVWKALASTPAANDETSLTPPQLFWTGSDVLLASGGTVSTYDPENDAWSVGPDPGAFGIVGASVWTGSLVISFGGEGCPPTNCTSSTSARYASASKYDPATATFSAISTVGAPEARTNNVMLWTGSEVLVWGGDAVVPNPDGGVVGINTNYNDGGLYDPVTDSWVSFSGTAASAPRDSESAVWTGTEMIVWGGQLLTPGLFQSGSASSPPPMATSGVGTGPPTPL